MANELYEAAKRAAQEALADQVTFLQVDDGAGMIMVAGPPESTVSLEIWLDDDLFQVVIGDHVSFDEPISDPADAADEVKFLIDVVRAGLTETIWRRNGEPVIATVKSVVHPFQATTRSSFVPKFALARSETRFAPF